MDMVHNWSRLGVHFGRRGGLFDFILALLGLPGFPPTPGNNRNVRRFGVRPPGPGINLDGDRSVAGARN